MSLSTAVLPFTFACVAERLRPESYPIRVPVRIRWSDTQGGRVSPVGMAHLFEDARVFTLRALQITHAQNFHGMARAVTIEHVADATLEDPQLELGAGIAAVGRTSFTYALAAFQNGRCVALGNAVDVRVIDGRSGVIEDEPRAALLRHAMPSSSLVPPPASTAHPDRYGWSMELHTRFADTDMVGHLNNVSMMRYHDNAAMAFIREALGHTGLDARGHEVRVVRQDAAFEAETHYGSPLTLGAAVLDIQPHWFTLGIGSFQQGKRTTTCAAVVSCRDQAGNLQVWSDDVVKQLRSHRPA